MRSSGRWRVLHAERYGARRPIVFFVQASLSEYPTWIFLPLVFPLLFVSRSPRDWLRGGGPGRALLPDPTESGLLAVLALLGRVRLAGLRGSGRAPCWPWRASPCSRCSLLPAAHNLYYGGQLVWTTLQAQGPGATAIAPRKLGGACSKTRRCARKVWYQVDHMFYLHTVRDHFPRGDWVSWVAIRGIQVLWLAAALLTLARRVAPGTTKVADGPAARLSRGAPRLPRWSSTTPGTSSPGTSPWRSSRSTRSGEAGPGDGRGDQGLTGRADRAAPAR